MNFYACEPEFKRAWPQISSRVFELDWDRDIKAIARQTQGLQSDLKDYLRDQERIVPPETADIDTYLVNNSDNRNVLELSRRRLDLQAKCDRLYEMICLVVALSLFASEITPEGIDEAITDMGFQTNIEPIPVMDWNAVANVTICSSLLMLAFNGLYALVFSLHDFSWAPTLILNRGIILRFAVIYTIIYAIVMWLAIRLKRKWRRKASNPSTNPENFLIAFYGYLLTVPFNMLIGRIIRGEWTYAPFLFATNQAILGYFIGSYIDRSLKTTHISFRLAVLQGIAQAVGITIATQLSPPIGRPQVGATLFIGGFSLLQAVTSGFIVGILFQHFYGQTRVSRRATRTDPSHGVSDLAPVIPLGT